MKITTLNKKLHVQQIAQILETLNKEPTTKITTLNKKLHVQQIAQLFETLNHKT
jgi:Mg/Co/Ni transporter MgtE